jgi:hypothetical protein
MGDCESMSPWQYLSRVRRPLIVPGRLVDGWRYGWYSGENRSESSKKSTVSAHPIPEADSWSVESKTCSISQILDAQRKWDQATESATFSTA